MMLSSYIFTTAIIATVFYTSFVQCENVTYKSYKRSSIRVCGIKLVNTLKRLCNHCYKEPQIRADKRAPEQEDTYEERQEFLNHLKRLEELNESEETASDVIDMYLDKRLGRSRQPKPTSGIANKCCINQCGWTDLMSYCCKKPKMPPPSEDILQ